MKSANCPMSAADAVQRYFLENRARVIEVAAFLDRLDRVADADVARADFRYRALKDALLVLATAKENRAAAVQRVLSDPTHEPRESAVGLKGAFGAHKGA